MKNLKLKTNFEDWQIEAIKEARKLVAYLQQYKTGEQYPFKEINLDSVLGIYIAIHRPHGMAIFKIAFANTTNIIMRELKDYLETLNISGLPMQPLRMIPIDIKEKDELGTAIA